MHSPLLHALKNFNQTNLPAGTRLFHGCREKSPDTNPAQQSLGGSRKWFSQSAANAAKYTFFDSGDLGARLLWWCELSENVPSLQGSQFSLVDISPWGSEFPWKFPNAFADYAKAILSGAGPWALLDHPDVGGIYNEILLTMPARELQVIQVIELPDDHDRAEKLARDRFNC